MTSRLYREVSVIRLRLFGLKCFHLFSLEKLQFAANGARGEGNMQQFVFTSPFGVTERERDHRHHAVLFQTRTRCVREPNAELLLCLCAAFSRTAPDGGGASPLPLHIQRVGITCWTFFQVLDHSPITRFSFGLERLLLSPVTSSENTNDSMPGRARPRQAAQAARVSAVTPPTCV
ncbi:hypothetical protein OJAV_G00084720 [Oryzias javanicus]|uniref:Uncharacterized protein n=1 Tax=Oryzias javanicus TaxID=123683 RepID=A0A3S2UC23_ORYJA|nr:hypothetical protein OJAV_G00084720 [Oryzias javanicus]